jgi:spermidine synthase
MSNLLICYCVTFILSFCSISYELILAQSLSAFLENTVLRYSVTIGLYMCSLGVGSLCAGERWTRQAILNLLKIEILLTIFGGFSVVSLFYADAWNIGRLGFLIFSHGLILLIGFLSGFEIPLLVKIAENYKSSSVNKILSVNYAGAFVGTVIFAFYLYPKLGLLPATFVVGILNAISGIFLYLEEKHVEPADHNRFYLFLYFLGFLFLILSLCVIYADPIQNFLMNQYLSK